MPVRAVRVTGFAALGLGGWTGRLFANRHRLALAGVERLLAPGDPFQGIPVIGRHHLVHTCRASAGERKSSNRPEAF
jgi:hypothetical protein